MTPVTPVVKCFLELMVSGIHGARAYWVIPVINVLNLPPGVSGM